MKAPVWFCSNVGGGIFGGHQTTAWRALGLDARLHHGVEVGEYWRAKSSPAARLGLRWTMYASYPLRLLRAVSAAGRGEIFVAVTNPFFLPALAARAARRSGARVVHLVYDLYPDALAFGGGWSPGHPVARFAAATTRAAIAECAATVYLGDQLRRYAEDRYGVAKHTAVIPVGTDAAVFRNAAPARRDTATVSCLYAGHLGRLHDWRTLAGALSTGVPENIAVGIAADGPGSVELKRSLTAVATREPARLRLGGTRGDADWHRAMLATDVALVTMVPGAEKVVMPSKTYSAMAAGQAILAVCPRNSDLAHLILKHDCGWVIPPGDTEGLRARLSSLPTAAGEVFQKRKNAWRAAHAHYSMQAVGEQWRDLLSTLGSG